MSKSKWTLLFRNQLLGVNMKGLLVCFSAFLCVYFWFLGNWSIRLYLAEGKSVLSVIRLVQSSRETSISFIHWTFFWRNFHQDFIKCSHASQWHLVRIIITIIIIDGCNNNNLIKAYFTKNHSNRKNWVCVILKETYLSLTNFAALLWGHNGIRNVCCLKFFGGFFKQILVLNLAYIPMV